MTSEETIQQIETMHYPLEYEVLDSLSYSYDIDFRNTFFNVYRFIGNPKKHSIVLSSLVDVLKPLFYDTYDSLCKLILTTLEIDLFMSSVYMLRSYCNALLLDEFIDDKWQVIKC